MRKLLIGLSVIAVALALTASATSGIVESRSAVLSGATEIPGPGDADGSGFARVIFVPNPGGLVCWSISVAGIGPVAAAHIHVGPAGVAGPIVIDFSGQLNGCTRASRPLIFAILANPSAYYVNVHTPEFPGGAVRGQLTGF
jgi:hypothetical protein